ncbi:hypothetical protein C2855_21320 [Aeromonas bestiarum]|nr:hypothetical protein C2855_21320 [Aeromonas bestiarum]
MKRGSERLFVMVIAAGFTTLAVERFAAPWPSPPSASPERPLVRVFSFTGFALHWLLASDLAAGAINAIGRAT